MVVLARKTWENNSQTMPHPGSYFPKLIIQSFLKLLESSKQYSVLFTQKLHAYGPSWL